MVFRQIEMKMAISFYADNTNIRARSGSTDSAATEVHVATDS
jgi:hypothetical protein